MYQKKDISFNQYKISGWICKSCGEIYFDADEAQRILVLNKLKNKSFKLSLNKVKSNLILRIPKEISEVMNLETKKKVNLKLINKEEMKISV